MRFGRALQASWTSRTTHTPSFGAFLARINGETTNTRRHDELRDALDFADDSE